MLPEILILVTSRLGSVEVAVVDVAEIVVAVKVSGDVVARTIHAGSVGEQPGFSVSPGANAANVLDGAVARTNANKKRTLVSCILHIINAL